MKFPAYLVLLATLIAHVLLPSLNASGVEQEGGQRIVVCTALGIQVIDLSGSDSQDAQQTDSAPYQCPCIHFSHTATSFSLANIPFVQAPYQSVAPLRTQAISIRHYISRAPPVV